MKKLVGIILLSLPLALQAQQLNDEASLIQSLFGSDKRKIVTEFVGVEGATKEAFLQLYDEYEANRKAVGQKKFTALNNYVKNYNSLNETETENVMTDIISFTADQDKLVAAYYKKIRKKCGVVAAAQFYQIEWYLLSEIRTSVLESIPVINRLEKKK